MDLEIRRLTLHLKTRTVMTISKLSILVTLTYIKPITVTKYSFSQSAIACQHQRVEKILLLTSLHSNRGLCQKKLQFHNNNLLATFRNFKLSDPYPYCNN